MTQFFIGIVVLMVLGGAFVLYVAPMVLPTDTPSTRPIEMAQNAVGQKPKSDVSQSTGGDTSTKPLGGSTRVTGTVINMSGKGLTSVPKEVFSIKDATTLDVSHNALTGALPAEVRQLSNLEVLDLSNNQFTGVPAEVGQLSKLRVLRLSNNPITGLPYEIGNLKNLERLELDGTNYAKQDLDVIKAGLSADVLIVTD